MPPNRQGVRRIRRPAPMEHDVVVEDINSGEPGGRGETIIPVSQYRIDGYSPPFENLPWQGE